MTTTSTNFALTIATTSDTVNVVSQIAGNFTTVDSLFGVAHTGTGQLKTGLTIQSPVLVNPTLSGTLSAGTLVSASTGSFTHLIVTSATIGTTFVIGTYAYPSTIGSTNQILVVTTGNLIFASNAGLTAANTNMSNLAVVVINTNLNTFTGGRVTIAEILATSGTLSGLTSVTASTMRSVTLSATTATFNTITATGGLISGATATALTILSVGTYSYPATVGSTGQILTVTTGNVVFASAPQAWQFLSYATFTASGTNLSSSAVVMSASYTKGETYHIRIAGVAASSASGGYYLPCIYLNTATAGERSFKTSLNYGTSTSTSFAAFQSAGVIQLATSAGGGSIRWSGNESQPVFNYNIDMVIPPVASTHTYLSIYGGVMGGDTQAQGNVVQAQGLFFNTLPTSVCLVSQSSGGDISLVGGYWIYRLNNSS